MADAKIPLRDQALVAGHRHLSNIDCLKTRTAGCVCFISTVNGRRKKRKRSLERLALVAGIKQTLSNLFCTFEIYVAGV